MICVNFHKHNQKIELIQCNFLHNFVDFQRTESETGVALFMDSEIPTYILNSTFLVCFLHYYNFLKKNSKRIIP